MMRVRSLYNFRLSSFLVCILLILAMAQPIKASFESVEESASSSSSSSSSSTNTQQHHPSENGFADAPTSDGQPQQCMTPEHNADEFFHKQNLVYTTLAGRDHPFWTHFRKLTNRDDLMCIMSSLRRQAHPEDMALMLFVGWTTVPAVRALYYLFWRNLYVRLVVWSNNVMTKLKQRRRGITDTGKEDVEALQQEQGLGEGLTPRSAPIEASITAQQHEIPQKNHKFRHSKLFLISDHIQQIAKIALLIYSVDVAKLFLVQGLGFQSWGVRNFQHAFAQLAYTIWMAQRMSVAKKSWVRDYVSRHPETYGRMKITNRLINVGIIALAGCVVLSILKLQMGVAVHSFLAMGSLSTLAITLASKDIVTNILNGLLLASSDRVYEGDFVRFGSGLKGTIDSMGWMETVIRGEDEVMISVQHSDLVKQQVANLSRVRYSQVYQVLKFKYKDADKLPELIQAIKNEIYSECPSLITDGERPFRVFWSDYGSDSLEVTVDAHFRLRILSDDYHDNRQRVLMAIRRAVKNTGITFAKE